VVMDTSRNLSRFTRLAVVEMLIKRSRGLYEDCLREKYKLYAANGVRSEDELCFIG
jgi:hypothetical protein